MVTHHTKFYLAYMDSIFSYCIVGEKGCFDSDCCY